jgi:phosphomethylpyrimidine synthase
MLHRSALSSDTACPTQLRLAREGVVSPEMRRVVDREHLDVELVREEAARGRMIIPASFIMSGRIRWRLV